MYKIMFVAVAGFSACLLTGDVDGRGFGGFAGGGGAGGFRSDNFRSGGFNSGDFRTDSYTGGRSFDYSGSHSFDSFSGDRAYGGTSSYDRSYTGSRGGTYTASGDRGAYASPWGAAAGGTRDVSATGPDGRSYSSSSERGAVTSPWGSAAGGSRDVSATGIDGRSYSGSREGGVAAGPYGRTIGGFDRSATGTYGHMSTDFGLAHYSSFNTAAVGHNTVYWSHASIATTGGYVRSNFGYAAAFRPAWYTAHPGAWVAAGWDAGVAWAATPWATLASDCALSAAPIYYDYGNTVIYNDDTVYQNGDVVGTAAQYAQQATALADQGQQVAPPPQTAWQPLGVFALVQGTETSSNNLFQLAINGDGVLRGNYYDGLMDTTTPIYGSLDKKTQRIAWTIGKKNDRVFDCGLYNLTKSEAPVLVHFGATRTVQMLLVRIDQQPTAAAAQ